MVSSSPDASESGFATPAAMVISLAIALTATAVLVRSLYALRSARADLARTQMEYWLDGVQLEAGVALMTSRVDARQAWVLQIDGESVQVLAEPEAAKVRLAEAANLPADSVRRLRLEAADHWATSLAGFGSRQRAAFEALPSADPSQAWRACARSVISPYGAASALRLPAAQEPKTGPVVWRIGQLWRIRVRATNGWTDDRVVRFTGNPEHPLNVVARAFARERVGEGACEAAIGADR